MVLEAVRFIFFSAIEFTALLILSLSIFRFKMQYYKKEISLTVLLLSILSYILYLLNLKSTLILIQFLALVIFLRFLFAERNWLYNVWIVLVGHILYILMQAAYVFLCLHLGFFETLEEASLPLTYKSELSQVICAAVGIIVSVYIKYFQEGFHFSFQRIKKRKTIYLHMCVTSILILAAISYTLYYYSLILDYFLLILITLCISFVVLIIFSYKRDSDEFDYNINE